MAEEQNKNTQGERENRENGFHDESVLNPEMKNELDMSRKERKQREKEKLKNMGPGAKLQYIWMYYKPHIFGFLGVLLFIYLGYDMYQNSLIETVLSVTIVNSSLVDTEEQSKEILELLGYADDPYSDVQIGTNMYTSADGETFDYSGQMAFMAKVQAQDIDVMVMPESLYESMKDDDAFADLREVLDEETYASFGDKIDEKHLMISDPSLGEELGVPYDPICAAVIVNSAHTEDAGKWLASLVD